jgi:DNA-binding transcriptional MerR regulator/methylmalonyl-CoA mutase cobalamin-binding subunit
VTELHPDARYQIGTVARVTGLSTHTIRVWERRYGVVEPARTPGGSRVYSDADVTKLRLLKRLTDDGHSIGRIAHLSESELRGMIPGEPGEPDGRDGRDGRGVRDARGGRADEGTPAATMERNIAEVTRHRFQEALDALDITAAERLLLYAAGFLEARTFLLEVVVPIIADISQRWERSELRIAHEHAASALLRNLLGTLMRTQPPQMGRATAVATTLSGELHEFGALMAALMAAAHGWKVVYLGPNLPAGEILHVLEQSDASLLMLSLVDDRNPLAERELGQLMRGLPAGIELIVGGRSAYRYSDLLDGRVTVSHDLVSFENLLTRLRH